MTDLEFKLYEALRHTETQMKEIYDALCCAAMRRNVDPDDDLLLRKMSALRDEVIWPAVYGDDDVIKAMDRERELRNDDTNGMFCGDSKHEGCSWCLDRNNIAHGQPGHGSDSCRLCRGAVPTIFVDDDGKVVGNNMGVF